jgi:O-antigen ligase
MKNYSSESFQISEQTTNAPEKAQTFFRLALCLAAATIPFNSMPFVRLSNSYSIVLLAVAWLFEGTFKSKWTLLKERKLIYAFFAFYLVFCFGLLFTSNMKAGYFQLEKKSYLVVLPLIIGTSVTFNKTLRNLVLKSFVISCLVATAVSLINALVRYYQSGNAEVFYYLELSSFTMFHPPYFGMFLTFSILIITEYLMRNRTISSSKKITLIALAFYFFCFIILLSARMVTIYGFIVLFTAGVYFFYNRRKLLLGMVILSVMITISIAIIFQSPSLKDRLIKPLTSDIHAIDGGKETGLSIRLIEWKCSLEGFLEAPLTGVGTGDGIDYQVKCYEKEKFWGMYPQYQYNSHNEYLQLALTLGLPGLICFGLCMMVPLAFAFRTRNYLLMAFVTMFAFCSLTESTLERQFGVVFFAFFIPFFYFLEAPSRDEKLAS